MKVRNGFVSNSSSSSFIVELTKSIEDYTLEEFIEEYQTDVCPPEGLKILYKDLKKTQSYVSSVLEDDDLDVVTCHVNLDYDHVDISWEEEQALKEQIEKYGRELVREKLRKDLFVSDDKYTRYCVRYHDYETYCPYMSMETDFMPKFKGTIKIEDEH